MISDCDTVAKVGLVDVSDLNRLASAMPWVKSTATVSMVVWEGLSRTSTQSAEAAMAKASAIYQAAVESMG